MDLRRALLLFAIVLGLAAIASSITRPSDGGGDDTNADRATETTGDSSDPPAATPSPGTPPVDPTTIRFSSSGKRELRKLEPGRPATVLVTVDVPGQVEIPSLGLTQPAEPVTPARFDLLVPQAGSHRIVLRPADAEAGEAPIGTLEVVAKPGELARNGR
jgi:hypothetical protein